ncbi:MAG: hypothetical protein ACF8XB_16625 [Planctomycetota bacterium JB042]
MDSSLDTRPTLADPTGTRRELDSILRWNCVALVVAAGACAVAVLARSPTATVVGVLAVAAFILGTSVENRFDERTT